MFDIFSLQIIFLETICNDERIIERNIRLKIQQSPDYAEEYGCLWDHLFILIDICVHTKLLSFCRPDFEAGLRDFKTRLANYANVVP